MTLSKIISRTAPFKMYTNLNKRALTEKAHSLDQKVTRNSLRERAKEAPGQMLVQIWSRTSISSAVVLHQNIVDSLHEVHLPDSAV